MPERNPFWTTGTATRMQNQRDVVLGGRRGLARTGITGKTHGSGRVQVHHQYRNFVRCRCPGIIRAVGRHDQQLGLGVLEIESELFGAVCGIEGRRGGNRRCSEHCHQRRQTVTESQSDAIPAPDTQPGKPCCHRRHLIHEVSISDLDANLR
jgi:hypothetical protein